MGLVYVLGLAEFESHFKFPKLYNEIFDYMVAQNSLIFLFA